MNGTMHVVDDLPGAFSDTVIQAFQRRQDEEFCMALSGGPTARACYERLAESGAELIDWWAVNVFWSHERCVAPDDPESNQLLVRQSLLERVGAANAVYPMRCDEGPGPYQLRLGEIGKLDLVHLTLGPDGHTASLFAGSAAIDADPGQWVTLADDPTGQVPHYGMTLTLSGIAHARLVVFTVAERATGGALQAIVDGADCPAARVAADEVIWLVDREIAPRRG